MFIQLMAMLLSAAPAAQARISPLADIQASEAEVRRLEAEWTDAVLRKDTTKLREVMSPEFALTFAGAPEKAVSAAAWLNNLRSMQFVRYEVRVENVDVMGKVAVAKVTGSWTVSMEGKTRSQDFSLLDTWVQRSGRWQVYRRHRSK
jgi:ketosteroid isomerase-like protein